MEDFRHYLEQWSDDLELLRQNRLLGESTFITFARDRGVPVCGVVSGEPGELHKRGWLTSDGKDDDGPLFHPFRMYPLHQTLKACNLNMAASASLQRDSLPGLVESVLQSMRSIEQIGTLTVDWNRVVDLAIPLEPVYWPAITGRLTLTLGTDERERRALLDRYRRRALDLVRRLDPDLWRVLHESLRIDAAWMDGNRELYVLLRLANWDRREHLQGAVSCALWIRHVAEVVRRGFEEAYNLQWPEEDEAFGHWHPGGRNRTFGSERPLDDELRAKPYIAWQFGLFTGSAVRWYVEGETEYYAVREILPEPSRSGIELVNLRGVIKSERDNAALKLRDWLTEDKALRRFSMISFDRDDTANVKAIRRQVEDQNVVGLIAPHTPDFEFANFTASELVEIAAGMDEADGFLGSALREASLTGVSRIRDFQRFYRQFSARKRGLQKGEKWGRALAAYALKHPDRSDDNTRRPLWHQIRAALQGRISNYDRSKEYSGFDPNTFEPIDRRATGQA